MREAAYARIVFGGSAVLLGVLSLMWFDADTWQTLRQIWSLPFGAGIGAGLMCFQIAGGMGMQFARSARAAGIALVVVYGLFSLACVPGIVAAPTVYEHYGSFFEQFCALSGAVTLLAVSPLARVGLGLSAVSFTLSQIFYFALTAQLVPRWIPPNQKFWAVLTTIAFGLAAIAILINRRARLALRLMALMVGLFGVLVWIPRLITHPEAHGNWSEFGLTMLITGATWMVACVDTDSYFGRR